MAYEQLAKVHLLDALYHMDKAYDYRIPAHLIEKIHIGDFVLVPFGGGNRRQIGVIFDLPQQSLMTNGFQYKPLFSVLDEEIRLNSEQIRLCHYLKEHTYCTIGDAIKAIMPACAFSKWIERYACSDKEPSQDLSLRTLSILRQVAEGNDTLAQLKTMFGAGVVNDLQTLVGQGYLQHTLLWKEQNRKYIKRVYLTKPHMFLLTYLEGNQKLRSSKQIHALQTVIEQEGLTPKELMTLGVSESSIKTLVQKGLLEIRQIECIRNPYQREEGAPVPPPPTLNEEQQQAFERISNLYRTNHAHAVLLHGVTGSGKTQVIRAMIDFMLSKGRQVILMVPEIALTPQTVRIFITCYGERTAVLHSGLSAGERYDAWRRIKNGDVDICIGTRSAVFAPFSRLGMIVMDEEQEHTYKSDSNPKYHARDIARVRCAHQNAILLLASATPSLESYYKAKQGIYHLVTLTKRYGNATLPQTRILDVREEARQGILTPIGQVLAQELLDTKEKEQQSILFLNRRGYHSFLVCPSCGEVIRCSHCSVSLTHHKTKLGRGQLRCHYCGYRTDVPKKCPSCQFEHLTYTGFGTQQTQEYLTEHFPELSVLRMDADTTISKFSYEEMIEDFVSGKSDVLLGTQMVAKGHDFPKVTLVGVLNADQSLYVDDFRSNERTFSLLTQVIGRAGRAEKHGQALIQTYQPDHPVLQLAAKQDYVTFYEQEIALRKATVFPPFCDLTTLLCSAVSELELNEFCQALLEYMKELLQGDYSDVKVIIYGPMEPPIYKINDKYRLRFVLKCRMNQKTRDFVRLVLIRAGEFTKKVSVSVDVNPNHT